MAQAYAFLRSWPMTSLEFMVAHAFAYNGACWAFSKYMKDKEPFRVGAIARVHNAALSAFSLILALVVIAFAYRDGIFATHETFHCHPPRSDAMGIIFYLFYLSKMWEMVDTFLLIASKKPVIWLHQIHHASTVSVVGFVFYGSVGHEFVPLVENLFVHFFMYAYFYDSKRFKSFRIIMTTLQIVQFIHVLIYCIIHLKMWNQAGKVVCDEDGPTLVYITFWYVAYLVLFINFFIQQYLQSSAKGKANGKPTHQKGGKVE